MIARGPTASGNQLPPDDDEVAPLNSFYWKYFHHHPHSLQFRWRAILKFAAAIDSVLY